MERNGCPLNRARKVDRIAGMFDSYVSIALAFSLVLHGATLVVLGFYVVRFQRRNEMQAQAAKSLQDDLAALCSGAVGMGERFDRLEERVRILTERHEQLEMKEPVIRSYRQARDLLEGGAGIDDLVAHCGVTHGEAELITVLHRLENKAANH